jgi:hypothetical protein
MARILLWERRVSEIRSLVVRGVMLKEAVAITLGLVALAAIAYVGVEAAGIRSEAPSQIARDHRGESVCTDYCPIGARTAIPGL